MPIREIKFQIRVVVDRDGDSFHAYTPDLKGVHACGETEREALESVREGVVLYVESLAKHRESIPVGMLVLDREHSSFFALISCIIKERLSKHRRRSFVEEVTVSTQKNDFVPC